MEPRPTSPATMSIQEAAKVLGISDRSAYPAARRNEFPNRRVGGRVLVPVAAFYRWLAEDTTQKESAGNLAPGADRT